MILLLLPRECRRSGSRMVAGPRGVWRMSMPHTRRWPASVLQVAGATGYTQSFPVTSGEYSLTRRPA